MSQISTERNESATATLHPRPQFRRRDWVSLNGQWRFMYDDELWFKLPQQISHWQNHIQVPFAPECKLSGIADQGFHRVCWYEREFELPELGNRRWLLHFGAADYSARVWVNDHFVGEHQGGFTPFCFDISAVVRNSGTQKVTVRIEDDPHDLAKPRGKQDWQLEPHSIWYPRTTGIWQTVWIEPVSQVYIERVRWTPHLERWEIGFEAFVAGSPSDTAYIIVKLSAGDHLLVNDKYQVIIGEVHRRIALSDPGIDDFRNELLWTPEKPTLIHADIELWQGAEKLDHIYTYTALRSVAVQHGDFVLNGRPYYLRLVLDQGYWPESLMTAPTPEHLRKDIELTKAMGFNGVRKHQKIEDPHYLFWADVLGLLVWEEMPSAYRFTHESVERLMREWTDAIDRDYNHPCIAAWVPFNESWGVPDLVEKAAHRNCVQAFYHLTKTLDSTRPVIGNDGWENSATDIIGIHDYDNHPKRLRERYSAPLTNKDILSRRSPAGRMLTVEGYAYSEQPIVLTEFGGIAFAGLTQADEKAWGYAISNTSNDLQRKYAELLRTIHDLPIFRGFCYTQFTDTYQEVNGLLYADRTPKFPLNEIEKITKGKHTTDTLELTIGTAGSYNGETSREDHSDAQSLPS